MGQKIRIIIAFTDGTQMNTNINADEGSFYFRVIPECPGSVSYNNKCTKF